MAQSGYTPILIYASGTTGNAPSASNLTSSSAGAELALNYFDGKLFYKDASGNVQVLAGKGGTGVVAGSNTQVQYNNNGVFGASANMVFNGTRLTVADLADSGLTAGRVTYASSGGALVDSANLTFDGTNLTLGGGTANGVAYLNGSKVLTTGSALTFDGTNLGIGSSPSYPLHVQRSSYGVTGYFYTNDGTGNPRLVISGSSSGTTIQNTWSTGASNLIFANGGAIGSGTEVARFDVNGNFGIGTSSPAAKIEGHYTSTAPSLSSSSGVGLSLRGSSSLRVNIGSDPSSPFGGWIQSSDNSGNAFPLNLNPLGGNVGIGTSSPQGKFNVGGGRSNFGANSETYSVGVGYTQARVNSGQTYYIGATDSATPDLVFSNAAGTERMRVTTAGDVGIGTSSPGYKLSVVGVIQSTTGGFRFPDGTTQTTAAAGGGSGTVTSVATGNGLQGGTITTSGTLSVACPTFNTVGSYTLGFLGGGATLTSGSNYSAGGGTGQVNSAYFTATCFAVYGGGNNLSGTWKNMGGSTSGTASAPLSLFCRVA